ncbi:phosphoribosyltransferase family protein [Microbacterium sp. BWT-B31]|uniref:phosphoribosyltransferase n=1 Tax=Microbacterium sp. BWT-B31 TaxID=3232072 RepID=UPI003528FE2F
MVVFADRTDAGRLLAPALDRWRGTDAVVCGIPRGGVVVAAEVARILNLPLTVVTVRKLGAPNREEYAVGAIADEVRIVDLPALRASGGTEEQLADVERRERAELIRRGHAFDAFDIDVAGRTAIVVDDGIATGSTATAACRALRLRGARRIVLAVPVAPVEYSPGADAADQYECLHRVRNLWAVGQHYGDFRQTDEAEVVRLLAAARTQPGTTTAGT